MRAARIFSAFLRIAFVEALAYRAELLLWVLSTSMPLVMMAFFSAVAEDAPMARFGQREFVAYFLVTLIVRHMTGSWAAWQLGHDIRQGTLAPRLLRPVHPLLSYVAENLASLPLRLIAAFPVFVAAFVWIHPSTLTTQPIMFVWFIFAIVQAWALTMLFNLFVGSLSFFLESGVKLMDLSHLFYLLASGYLVPIELFPGSVRRVFDWLPFRYQIALPVELLTQRYDHQMEVAHHMMLAQSAYCFGFAALLVLSWKLGCKRFGAFGH